MRHEHHGCFFCCRRFVYPNPLKTQHSNDPLKTDISFLPATSPVIPDISLRLCCMQGILDHPWKLNKDMACIVIVVCPDLCSHSAFAVGLHEKSFALQTKVWLGEDSPCHSTGHRRVDNSRCHGVWHLEQSAERVASWQKTDTPARMHCKACIDESSMRQESPFGSAQSPVESPQRVYTQSCQ